MSQTPSQIEVSPRIRRLPPYLFARINRLRDEKRRAGVDIIDLGMGNPQDAPSRTIVEKLCESARHLNTHGYSQSIGIPNLRREVAKLYDRRYGVSLDPEAEVIAVLGSKEGFSHMCLALLGPGDTAVVGDPYFPIHVYAVALAGGNVINVPLGAGPEFLERVAYVAEHLYPTPKVLILNFPHNPTAMTVDDVSFFEDAVALARRCGMMIIHDFAYGRTCFDGYEAPSFLQAEGAKDVGVEFLTMSKPYNMAGWRIGFCVGNAEMIRALATIKGYYDYGIFTPIQVASIIALRECAQDIDAQAGVYTRRRDVVVEGLRRAGWRVDAPRASMFVWARVCDEHLAGQGTIDFAMRMLEEAEVALAPGRAFGENGEGYVRIALVENEHRLRQAMRQLNRALNKGITAPSATKLKRKGGQGG
ncbi:MAG: aminotransferase class I/II-fold pyridoxal phosphate-dependent enzyme [Phycisphaerae bacterium]|nr:aminotransferase class I/II-fold pyridoxal phosphate-dependent enzyme [Phycisphaerae bacterium]